MRKPGRGRTVSALTVLLLAGSPFLQPVWADADVPGALVTGGGPAALACAHDMGRDLADVDAVTGRLVEADLVGRIRRIHVWPGATAGGAQGGTAIRPTAEWLTPLLAGGEPIGVSRLAVTAGKATAVGCSADVDLARALTDAGDGVLVEQPRTSSFYLVKQSSGRGADRSSSNRADDLASATVQPVGQNASVEMDGRTSMTVTDLTAQLAAADRAREVVAKKAPDAVGGAGTVNEEGPSPGVRGGVIGGGVAAILLGVFLLARRRRNVSV